MQRLHSGTAGALQQIVRHGHERVFLDERPAVLAEERQPVHIRVNADSEVGVLPDHRLAEPGQVLRQRFGVMGEVAVGSAVQQYAAHAELLQELRHYDRADRIYRIHDHGESGLAHRVGVHSLQRQHRIHMLIGEIVVLDMAEPVDAGEVKVAALRDFQYLIALGGRKELPVGVQQLQRIPLAGVVAGGDDDSAIGSGEAHRELRRGRRG